MNKCKDCSHFEHPDKIECELEKWPWSINGEERGWCHKIHVKEDRVAYGWFVTPNTESDCPYFKYDPRNWDGISEDGSPVPSGLYIYELRTSNFRDISFYSSSNSRGCYYIHKSSSIFCSISIFILWNNSLLFKSSTTKI